MKSNHHTNHASQRHIVLAKRLLYNFLIGLVITLISLSIGIMGFIYFEGMPLVDAYANAATVLSGLGPMYQPKSEGGKLFVGTYGLFSGVVFLITVGIIFAPIFHHFSHLFHLKDSDTDNVR